MRSLRERRRIVAADPAPSYLHRIVVDPKIMLGKPTVRGARIPVELILEQRRLLKKSLADLKRPSDRR